MQLITESFEDDFERELEKHDSTDENFELQFLRNCNKIYGMGRFKVETVFEAIDEYPEGGIN